MAENAGRIDLHVHTTASDGGLTPTEVVELAKKTGLAAIAITDHDTIAGIAEGLAAGQAHGLPVVPGVELSSDFRDKTVHILGYFVDPENPEFAERLEWARAQRIDRNNRLIDKFAELGIEMTLAEVEAEAGGEVVGRPHFAKVLLKKGAVENAGQAFSEYLSRRGKAYLPKVRFDAETAVRLIKKAGGVPVWAHPILTGWTPLQIDDAAAELAGWGLAGLEVFYSHHNPTQVLYLSDIARRRKLIMTGGSDFHGPIKPKIRLGYGMGDLAVPYSFYENLKSAAGIAEGPAA